VITPKAQQLRERIDKWDYMKLKSSCKENSFQTEEAAQECEKTFASYISDKGLIVRIYRELKKLNSQRIKKEMGK
jgi:hypothetical protein